MYFDPCHARATAVRARFLAAAFSDGSYLAHVNGAYLRHVTFCIVRGPLLFIVSPICQRGPASVRGPLPTVTVPGWSKVHDGEPLSLHRCQHGLRKMRESARNDISRTHANFARVHKYEQNTTYPYTLSHFIKCRIFLEITHLIVNCNMVLSWGWGI